MSRLRIAVVGVGSLGQHHARILAALPHADLVGVVDIKPDRAREVAAQYGTTAYSNVSDLAGRVDAVSIATPTLSHVAVALPFVESGAAVLVEKPLAATVEDADRLLAAADARGTVLAVGHTERFNPAVAAALPLVSRPKFVEIHRLGTFPERSLDIDVVFDLMIHDLDVLLATVGSEVASVEAVGVNVLTPRVDIANARLRFVSGCVANVTASRISRDRVRKARFFQHDAYISIDYAAQELEVYRLAPHPSTHSTSSGSTVSLGERSTGARGGLSTVEGQNGGRPVIQGGRIDVERDEPLRRELDDFVCAVRDRRPPAVTGRDGRAALALANRIAELM
jgi:predicted dehydrogenase